MKTEEVKLRISAEEKANWVKRADGEGVSLSKYIRDVINNVPTNVPTSDESVPTNGENVPTSGEDVPTNVPTNIETGDYSEVINEIRRIEDADFQADQDDISVVNQLIEGAGLSYNRAKKMLWKQEGDNWKLVYDFNK